MSRLRRHGHRRPQLLVGARRPGARAGSEPRPVAAAHRAQRRGAGRPRRRRALRRRRRAATASAPARSSPPSAWPRWPSPARSPSRWPACASTPSTAASSRPSATPRRSTGRHRRLRRLALLGQPVPGLEIRIVDPATGRRRARARGGRARDPGHVGHARLLQATRRDRASVPTTTGCAPATSRYLLDGELVVCGRIKDVIIVGGRNVFPEDVERAVADVDGVRAGNVIAFGVDGRQGKEALVVVAETQGRRADTDPPPSPSGSATPSACPPEDVVLVAPGTLPKTSSGKLQRSLCRRSRLPRRSARLSSGQLQPACSPDLSGRRRSPGRQVLGVALVGE